MIDEGIVRHMYDNREGFRAYFIKYGMDKELANLEEFVEAVEIGLDAYKAVRENPDE